jgi:hypothetical protein
MVKVSADQYTREQLGLTEDEITDSRARQVCEQIRDNNNFKSALSADKLVIQRFIRD